MSYTNSIMDDIRQNMGIDPGDTSRDAEILAMEPEELWDRWTTWNNLPGWGEELHDAHEKIWGRSTPGPAVDALIEVYKKMLMSGCHCGPCSYFSGNFGQACTNDKCPLCESRQALAAYEAAKEANGGQKTP